MRRLAPTLAVVLVAAPALAEEVSEGLACTTSAECGGELRCIDEHCRDPSSHASREALRATPKSLFGDGRGYQMEVLIGDVAAIVTVPVLIGLAVLTNNGLVGLLAVFPPSLTGPIIHIVHGRWAPALISFFGWAVITPSAALLGVATLGGLRTSNIDPGLATFAAVATAGAILMTSLDVYFARDVTKLLRVEQHTVRWAPSVVPVRGGGLASVGGSFW